MERISPKWIAFDVYATLIDREEGTSRAFREILRKNGAEHLNSMEAFNLWHYAVIRKYGTRFVSWKEAGREALGEVFSRLGINGRAASGYSVK